MTRKEKNMGIGDWRAVRDRSVFGDRMTPKMKELICRGIAEYYKTSRREMRPGWRQQDIDAITNSLVGNEALVGMGKREIEAAVMLYTSDHQSYLPYLRE